MSITAKAFTAEEGLAATRFVDSDHPAVRDWANDVVRGAGDDRERAVALFYAVRDGIRYDPYVSSPDPDDYRASVIVGRDRNWCVPKSILLTAGARAVRVPSLLGYADVRNHLASDKLLESMGTDVFAFHGYSTFLLDGRWVKATSAFNIEMCTRFGVKPIEFDGTEDALYHPFDEAGQRHMEYVRQRGEFVDFPWDEMSRVFQEIYGHLPGRDRDESPEHDPMFHD
ncbi:MAG: transglutaminase family protein [Actinomycetota bacterium]|nr:transglutaminase family protein [Actinomycetota bacterium]